MKATPIEMTLREVEAMGTGGKTAAAVRRRLVAAKAVKLPAPAPQREKTAPQPISKKEMSNIRSQRFPAAVRKRLSLPSPQPAEPADYNVGTEGRPSATPPKKKRSAAR